MKTIMVYQCELGKKIPLKYIGKVKYIGETFGLDSLTNGNNYYIVRDETNYPKVVDDSGEDYIYNLQAPAPLDGSSKGGKFYYIDDPTNFLCNYMDKFESNCATDTE